MPEIDSKQVLARTWILLAIDACDRAGLTPLPKSRGHRLIFLSNCLADLFNALPPSKRVLKYKRGPFYPDVQWHLDRLATMGLADIKNFSIEEDEYGPWMEANYLITRSGVDAVQKVRDTPFGYSTSGYIDELVFSFARLNARRLDQVAMGELNYSAPGIAEGALITFEDTHTNLALRKANEFEQLAPEILTAGLREKLLLYLRYIETEDAVV